MKAAPWVLAVAAAALIGGSASAQQKRVYIACDDHTDYMWTADEVAYQNAFLGMLDWYIALADVTLGLPPDIQSRFACDGSYWLWTYQQHRTPAEFQRLIDRIKSGHISAPMTSLVSCYGAQPVEAVLRGMYYAGRLEREHGIRFRMAVAMENQTMPWGLASLFAGAGALYTWKGICNCASKVNDAWDREHDIYRWVGPDGKSILTKWNSMLNGANSMGHYAEARFPTNIVNYVTTNTAFQARYPYNVIGCFGKGADDLATVSFEFPVTAFEMTSPSRRVIVSNEQDFFEDFEATHGANLPSVAYSYGNEWDLYSASMAEVSGGVKRAVERLRGAEAMATMVSLIVPGVFAGLDPWRDLAYRNLGLYWEHDWTADGPISKAARAAWQRGLAAGIQEYLNRLETDAVAALGALITSKPGTARFWVFNQLGWPRTDYADLPVPFLIPLEVVDVTTGATVPSQYVIQDGVTMLRVHAENVPPVGYKVYELRLPTGAQFGPAGQFNGNVLENGVYRLTVAERGAITSFVDQTQGDREFAKSVNGLMVNDMGPSGGSLTLESVGPVSITVRADAPSPLQHSTWITLFRDSRRIDVKNRIHQNFSATMTQAFSFNLNSPDVRHEEVGAIARARFHTQGGNYATKSARYDWLTLNHFAQMSGSDGAGVNLSNLEPSFFRLGNSTVDILDTATPQIRVLIGGQVDGPNLGIQNQGGDSQFTQHYALGTFAQPDPVTSMRMSLEHQNPLRAGAVVGFAPILPANTYSVFSTSNPRTILWALKPSEEGIPAGGVIARFWNVDGTPQSTTVQLAAPFTVNWAARTTHLETNEAGVPVSPAGAHLNLGPQEIQTVRLMPQSFP